MLLVDEVSSVLNVDEVSYCYRKNARFFMHEKCYTFIRLCKHVHEFYIDERPQSVFILGPPLAGVIHFGNLVNESM